MTSPDFEFKNNYKRAVLLLHGMTGNPSEMKKLGKSLNQNGFDVFCHSLPGHGNNFLDIKNVKWKDWYDFSVQDYLRLKKDYCGVYIAGHCLGAVLALALAEEYNDIPGIISISTTLFLDGWARPWYDFLMPMGLYTILRYYYALPESEPYGIKNEALRKRVSSLQKQNTTAMDNFPMSCIYELLLLSKRVRANMKKVLSPVLILHSSQDDFSSIKSAKFVYNNVSSDTKELILLENSYHMVIIDNDRELVFNKSVEFLKKLRGNEVG